MISTRAASSRSERTPKCENTFLALATARAKKVFSHFGVLSERELAARVEIIWERYVKVSNIEANCALDMAKTMILPAAAKYLGELACAGKSKGIAAVSDKVAPLADQL